MEDSDSQKVVNDCYDPSLKSGDTAAMTSHSSGFSPSFRKLYIDWVNGGHQGVLPMFNTARITNPDEPCTMNICVWYLNTLGKGAFVRIDDTNIARKVRG